MSTPTVRAPAVAGMFYPADPGVLAETLAAMVRRPQVPIPAIGIVVPHAAYVYSGGIAAEVYSRIRAPQRAIVLCPNHTGRGRPLALMTEGAWQTPLGAVPIDRELAEALAAHDPELEPDAEAHRLEHSLEVQLPFLQQIAGDRIRFVPIAVGTLDFARLERLGRALEAAAAGSAEPVLLVASSDMNHYEPDGPTRIKDGRAIERLLARDPAGLLALVRRERISMCGVGPAVAMLVAANALGASRAELAAYGTSGDVFGERDRVVGYAGVIVA